MDDNTCKTIIDYLKGNDIIKNNIILRASDGVSELITER